MAQSDDGQTFLAAAVDAWMAEPEAIAKLVSTNYRLHCEKYELMAENARQTARIKSLEAEGDALASRLAAAEAARDHLETVIADAVSVGEMQGEDFRLMPWSSLNAALAAALAGSREQAMTTEGE